MSRDTRPSLARLTVVELRKMADTRAGFWLLVAVAGVTLVAVAIRALTGDADDHGFGDMMLVALQPASILLPVVGILLVTSEWSQRTGQITFTLVPIRSRVLGAKVLAALALALDALLVCLAVSAVGTLVSGDGGWTYDAALLGQALVYLAAAMLTGVAFGAALLASAPAIVVYFALPLAWAALVSLAFFADVAPWLDTARALGPMAEEVLSGTQWARAGTALALWLLVPLAIGTYRITRREISA